MSNRDEWFKTIDEHWAHYLERDIPADAPDVQVAAMKHAFTSGAISGLQLGILSTSKADLAKHANDIEALFKASK